MIVGGAVLLLASFLPWYGLEHGIFQTGNGEGGPWVTAWQVPALWVPVVAGGVLAVLWWARRAGRIEAGWLPAVSVAVGLVGIALVVAQLLSGVPTADFGWFAYAPGDVAAGPLETSVRVGLVVGLLGLVVQTAAAAAVQLRRAAG